MAITTPIQSIESTNIPQHDKGEAIPGTTEQTMIKLLGMGKINILSIYL